MPKPENMSLKTCILLLGSDEPITVE